MGILRNRNEVFDYKIIDVKYAYPVPTHNKNKIMTAISAYLIERDVHTLGRFGEWAYINSDEAMARGMILGEKLKSN
jgi:UDP-galactopyranose mutase